jgi:hypothetical protein
MALVEIVGLLAEMNNSTRNFSYSGLAYVPRVGNLCCQLSALLVCAHTSIHLFGYILDFELDIAPL